MHNHLREPHKQPKELNPEKLKEGIDLLLKVIHQEEHNPNYSGGLAIQLGFLEIEGERKPCFRLTMEFYLSRNQLFRIEKRQYYSILNNGDWKMHLSYHL